MSCRWTRWAVRLVLYLSLSGASSVRGSTVGEAPGYEASLDSPCSPTLPAVLPMYRERNGAHRLHSIFFLQFSSGASGASAQRCLQYSWLGADSAGHAAGLFNDSELQWNGDGSLALASRKCWDFPKPRPIPCISPLVITADGQIPNGTEVMDSFSGSVLCNPGRGDVCAVVVFYFSGEVYNVSAYCTRVSVDGAPFDGSPPCISARKGAYVNQVCVCSPEGAKPCNAWTPGPTGAAARTGLVSVFVLLLGLLSCRKMA